MVHLPVGVAGWGVFVFGLLVIAYRVRGIDAPRPWVEWVERQFADLSMLRAIGIVLILAIFALWRYTDIPVGFVGWLYSASLVSLFLIAFGLAVLQNHLRNLIVATAEASDAKIKYVSIGVVVFALLWALAPWFY